MIVKFHTLISSFVGHTSVQLFIYRFKYLTSFTTDEYLRIKDIFSVQESQASFYSGLEVELKNLEHLKLFDISERQIIADCRDVDEFHNLCNFMAVLDVSNECESGRY